MLCPTCNQEMSFTGICPRCPRAPDTSSSSQAAGDPFPKQAAPGSGNKITQALLAILAFVMWVAVIVLGVLRTNLYNRGGASDPQILGIFLGVMTLPVLLGFAITAVINRGKKLKMSPVKKNASIAGITLVVSLLAFVGAVQQRSRFRHTDPKKEMARLLAEASGKSPVSPDSDWWESLMRDFFRSVIDRNKRYSQEIRELDTSALQHLYSPQSYSTKSGMQKIIAQLQATRQLDQKFGTGRPLLQDLEMKLRNVDASQSEKNAFLEGAKGSSEVFLGSQDKLLDLEQKWIDATATLYQFAIDHRATYVIQGKKLLFKDDALRLEFVAKQSEAIAQRKAFLDEKAGLDRTRNNMLTQIGLASKDMDAAPPASPEK